jgi:hypothetical protein
MAVDPRVLAAVLQRAQMMHGAPPPGAGPMPPGAPMPPPPMAGGAPPMAPPMPPPPMHMRRKR